jgi:serpin B
MLTTGARSAAVFLGLCCATPALPAGASATSQTGEDAKTAAQDANAFALDLYVELGRGGSANQFFSPSSLATALAMAHAGARGATAEEMAAVLHLSFEGERLHRAVGALAELLERDRAGLETTIANALWGQQGYPFRDEYLDLGAEHYGAALRTVDFRGSVDEARAAINDWVKGETAGKI